MYVVLGLLKKRDDEERWSCARTQTQTMDKSIKNAICNHTKKLICRPAHLLRYLFSCFFFVRSSFAVRCYCTLIPNNNKRKRKKMWAEKSPRQIETISPNSICPCNTQANHECNAVYTDYNKLFLFSKSRKKWKQIMTRYCRYGIHTVCV